MVLEEGDGGVVFDAVGEGGSLRECGDGVED